MNKKVKRLISSGAIVVCVMTSGGMNIFADEIGKNTNSNVNLEEALKDPIKNNIVLDEGKVFKDGEVVAGVTYETEIMDVNVKGDKELIELGLLDENYKGQILNSKTKGSQTLTVWYEHPYEFETKITFKLNFVKTIGTTTIKSSIEAGYPSQVKKLRAKITSAGTVSNVSPYKTTLGSPSTGSYVTKGGTSTSSFVSTHRDTTGNTVITPTTTTVKAKFESEVQGTSQVGFGIKTTITV